MARDWFTRAFGEAVADARRALIEEAWFGRAEPGGHDRVLHDKLHPDRGANDVLGRWLEFEHAQEHARDAGVTQPEHDFDR